MTDAERERLLELTAKAEALIGEVREWIPYEGAHPIHCTATACGVSASFSEYYPRISIGTVWTKYLDRGRSESVWFPGEEWTKKKLVRAAIAAASPQ